MTRKLIELHPGALAPTVRGLWQAAAEKLAEARQGIATMAEARDRVAYETGWTAVVDALEVFWARFFQEGKDNFSNFQPWCGAADATRKSDELLNYLIQARHQSQHGRISLLWSEGRLHIAHGFNGILQNVALFPDGTFDIGAILTPGSEVEAKVTYAPGEAQLPPIENKRWQQIYPAPKTHNGQQLGNSTPMHVAKMALVYYEGLLAEAFQKFGKEKTGRD